MSRSVRAALFDVDGTLVDTNYLHAVTWWEAFGQADYQVAMADIHRAIGMGSDLMLDELLPADRDKDADADIRAAHSTLVDTSPSSMRCGPPWTPRTRATRPPSPEMSSRASPLRTWSRRRWLASACRRPTRYSPATPCGMSRPAGRPGSRASAC